MIQENIATQASVLKLMRKYDYHPKKSLGQNFLTDLRVAEKIVSAAQITQDDNVIEIGPGLGGLTQILSDRAASVLAVELDKSLVEILNDIFADNSRVEIIQGDILKTDINALMSERGWKTAKLAANLPYYITTPAIMHLIESRCPLSSITVMIQREVAERLTAKPGCKEYGALTLTASYYADVSMNAIVPSNCFIPRPHIDSAVVTLDLNGPKGDLKYEDILFKCIRAAFGQRRKTLVNCLRVQDWINKDRDELSGLLQQLGFDENIRGEALSLADFIALSQKLEV